MKKFFTIIALVFVSACSSTSELGASGQSFTVSGYSYDQVWDAAVAGTEMAAGDQALEVEKRLNISRSDKADGEIEASTGMSLLSWGELVGVFVTPPNDAPSHEIKVDSLAKMKTNVFANNWEEEVSAAIKAELDKIEK